MTGSASIGVAVLLDLRREYLDTQAVFGDLCEEHGGREHVPPDRLEPFVRLLQGIAERIAEVDLRYLGIQPRAWDVAAIVMQPRHGTWFGDRLADGRWLDQAQTDILIRAELHVQTRWLMDGPTPQNADLHALLGEHTLIELSDAERERAAKATRQRGGISSDPVIRMLAFRAWGDRDERWFEDRGVRKGEPVMMVDAGTVVLAPDVRHEVGVVIDDGVPGSLVRVRIRSDRAMVMFRVGDQTRWRFKEPAGVQRDLAAITADVAVSTTNTHGLVTGDRFVGPPQMFGIHADHAFVDDPQSFRLQSADSMRAALDGMAEAEDRAICDALCRCYGFDMLTMERLEHHGSYIMRAVVREGDRARTAESRIPFNEVTESRDVLAMSIGHLNRLARQLGRPAPVRACVESAVQTERQELVRRTELEAIASVDRARR